MKLNAFWQTFTMLENCWISEAVHGLASCSIIFCFKVPNEGLEQNIGNVKSFSVKDCSASRLPSKFLNVCDFGMKNYNSQLIKALPVRKAGL